MAFPQDTCHESSHLLAEREISWCQSMSTRGWHFALPDSATSALADIRKACKFFEAPKPPGLNYATFIRPSRHVATHSKVALQPWALAWGKVDRPSQDHESSNNDDVHLLAMINLYLFALVLCHADGRPLMCQTALCELILAI